ncbi:MAG: ChrR family anti-sigma-E factor [Ferrovibrio sp.]
MSVTDLAVHTESTNPPVHHIPGELLLDYATGTLEEPWSLVVACHLTLCPHCRRELAVIESAAGTLIEQIDPTPSAAGAGGFAAVAAQLGPQEPAGIDHVVPAPDPDGLPRPLRNYIGDGIRWRWSGAGLQSFALPVTKNRGGMVSLLKVAPGAGLPMHSHAGDEMTLVLSGGYTVGDTAFQRGDVEVANGAVEHSPIAMAGRPCLCLAVTDAPLRFSGRLGWFFNQWARFSA